MRKIIDRYALDETGRNKLTAYANILKTNDSKTADIPFNMLITYDDEAEMRRFTEDLARYISTHAARRRVYLCEESELDNTSPLEKWQKNAGAFFIYADHAHTLEQRRSLAARIEELPEITFALCIFAPDCDAALKPDDHLYYRIFSEHIHISSANASVITSRFLRHLEERGFSVTEAFANDITAYIYTVYPKADLKNEAFIRDLTRRVANSHFGSGNESDMIDETSVPFYIKPEDSANTLNERAEGEATPVLSDISGTDAAPAENEAAPAGAASDTSDESSKKEKKLKRGPKSKKNKIQLNDDFNKDLPRKGCKQARTCNVVLLSLSTFSMPIRESTYYYDGKKGGTYFYQLEPVVRMLSKQLLSQSPRDCIDRLIMLCTNDAKENQTITLPDGTVREDISPLEFFKERVRDYLNPDLNAQDLFIDLDVDEDNPQEAIKNAVDTLRELRRNLPARTIIQLFVDRHGGFRGVQQYMDAILSLLRNEFPIIESYDVKFNGKKSVIINLGHDSIFDFVSGINEFTNYGRINSLNRYYKDDKPDIMRHIVSIANAIQLCDIYGFEKGLDCLTEYFKKPAHSSAILSIFEDAIRNDYKDLLTDKRSTVSEIEWCLDKGFYQQALTLIEGAMPKELCECGVIRYCPELYAALDPIRGKFEENTYIFNHSVTWNIPKAGRLNILKNNQYGSTNIGNSRYRQNMSKADYLITQTVFKADEIPIDEHFCHIQYIVDNRNRFYTFIALHCAFKELRNLSNHGSKEPYPISPEVLTGALRQYIMWAKDIEAYAANRKN